MRAATIITAVLALSATLLQAARADERALREALSLPGAAMWLDYKAPGLILAGTVRLADPAQRYLPEFKLPEAQGRPITLIDLVTHTAGLPREVPGEPAVGANPFERFSWANYKAYLATATLASAPRTAAAYSNLGFGLLGRALEGASGQPYPTLLQERITGPIGIPDTVLRLNEEQRQRLMTGHDFEGKPMPP